MHRNRCEDLLCVVLSLPALVAPTWALACSGPGAGELIAKNERLGVILCLVTMLLAVVFLLTRRLRSRAWNRKWPLVLLAVAHPGWWMSARHGDCGFTVRDGSILILSLTVIYGAVCWLRAKPDEPRATE